MSWKSNTFAILFSSAIAEVSSLVSKAPEALIAANRCRANIYTRVSDEVARGGPTRE